MTAGMISLTSRGSQKIHLGLILYLCFSCRKHPKFTLWSSMEPKT